MESIRHHGHRGHLDTQVMGACDDFPATAPQRDRRRLTPSPSPSGTPLPILRPVVSAARRVCCVVSVSIRSKRRIVIALV